MTDEHDIEELPTEEVEALPIEERLRRLERGRIANRKAIDTQNARSNEFIRRTKRGLAIIIVALAGSLFGVQQVANDASTAAEDAQAAVAAADAERSQRIVSLSQLINLFCTTNNDQDALLAQLIGASIASAGTSFGEGVDMASLSEFDIAVLRSIQTIADQSPDSDIAETFEDVLSQLTALLPCERIVDSYIAGDPIGLPPEPGSRSAEGIGRAIGRGVESTTGRER